MRTKRMLWPLCVVSWLLAFGGVAAAVVQPHVVEKGQSLAVIAHQYGVVDARGEGDWRRLCDANAEVKNPNMIFVGQELRIPDMAETVESRVDCELPVAPSVTVSPAKKSEAKSSSSSSSATQTTSENRVAASSVGDDFARLRGCESNGYGDKRNPLYRGAYQFAYSTWESVGGTGDPADAPPEEQDRRAVMLQARDGWGPWPTCRVILGLR